MDWTTDCRGNGGHLNHSGISKFTSYVGKFIDMNMDMPDRRNEVGYEAYDHAIEYLGDVTKDAF